MAAYLSCVKKWCSVSHVNSTLTPVILSFSHVITCFFHGQKETFFKARHHFVARGVSFRGKAVSCFAGNKKETRSGMIDGWSLWGSLMVAWILKNVDSYLM